MKILHSGTFDIKAGGPAMSTYLTMYGLRQLGVDAQLFMYPMCADGQLRGEHVPVNYASAPIDKKLLYSPCYKREMMTLGDYDIYHAQGIWQYPTYALVDVAKQNNRPYIITPRGMLYPQDIAKSSKFFKRLSLNLRLLRDLNRAACVHVTCQEEMDHCRNLGVTSPIAIIPNPVEIDDYPDKKIDDIFRVGYLGRLSPRKNVEALIYAFSQLAERGKDAELLIIGGGDDDYEAFLKSEVSHLKLTNIRFMPFTTGDEKSKAIASISVLAMPSEFENMGNVILEGLARSIPCIATKGSPWEELTTHRCGWWVDNTQSAITSAIASALDTEQLELQAMGRRGRKLMEQKYSTNRISMSMKALYEWIITNKNKPEFVYE